MSERDLVAPPLLRRMVQRTAPHPRAEIAGRLTATVIRGGKYIRFKHLDRNAEQRRILLDQRTVVCAIARIHHKIPQLKRNIAVLLQLLEQLCKQHGILAARNTDRDPIPGFDQLIAFQRFDKRLPKRLSKGFCNALFDQSASVKLPFHSVPSRSRTQRRNAMSLTTSPARISPTTAGTNAVLPGVCLRVVSASSPGSGVSAGSLE